MNERAQSALDLDQGRFDFRDPEVAVYRSAKGLTRETVLDISRHKNEPKWMTDIRLHAFDVFLRKPMPAWGGDLSDMDFDAYTYYIKPTDKREDAWEDVPENIRKTFDRLGIPEAEKKFLAGVGAQYESEMVYHSIQEDLAKKGVIFLDTESGLREHPELFRQYFATLVPPEDNKFAALNTACWSGGSFIYVPKGVQLDVPLQAYFRINSQNMGQFERTIIIADEGARLHYIEGCTAPQYSSKSLHTGVIEIFVHRNAQMRYTTIQNWAHNIYNLVTQRSIAHEGATMEWVDGNMGSKLTMKYPSIYLVGEGATGNILSVAFAADGQHQDAGAKIIHKAPNTSSTITSKSISRGSGRTSYRGLLKVAKGAVGVKASVKCDALMLNEESRSDTYPTMEIGEDRVTIAHEATVGKISDDQIFYLMSRGLSESDAMAMIVQGFIAPFAKELPMEYAIELNRLIQLEMEGSVG
ncbi:MAG: Fe-S cluster assembly protein SufB [Acidobacteriota bacterium]